MNRLIKYILCAAVLAAAVGMYSCTDDLTLDTSADATDISYNPDGSMNVTLGIEIPDIMSATRALGETPNFDDLTLYMFVFEQDKGLRQYEKYKGTLDNDDLHDGKLVKFKIELNPTEKATTIHFVATNQPDFESTMGYGTEDMLISSLYTTCAEDGTAYEAYWQRIHFEHNIPSAEQAGIKDPTEMFQSDEESKRNAVKIQKELSHIPMIRNFCRVSVMVENVDTDGNEIKFKATGLYVVNTVDRGSVAPYIAENPTGQRFVDYCKRDENTGEYIIEYGKYVGKRYDEINAQGYIGTLPVGVQLINSDIANYETEIKTKSEDPDGHPDPVYFYERPARTNSTLRTYVIIKGLYSGPDNSGKETFYKIDLGKIDEKVKNNNDKIVGVFAYYNLLRNFDYRIKINKVESDGYASFSDAANGAVYNNFSAAIEARNMTSISDGTDMIFAHFHDSEKDVDYNFTSYVFTQPNEVIDLMAQFRTDITNGTGGTQENNLIDYYLEPGAVVDYVVPTISHNGTGFDEWNTYKVYGNDPTDQLRQQTMYIFRGNKAADGQPADYGLYRVITFFSHTPWKFDHIDTFPGLWPDINDIPDWDWSEDLREVGEKKGSPLTLFFELPAGLPQALFPLDFVIESDRQNIQNAYAGNAVVQSVPAAKSLFNNQQPLPYKQKVIEDGKEVEIDIKPSAPTTSRVQYVKTVTWEDYFGGLSEELVGHGSSIVRCRFQTITDLNQDGIGSSSTTSSPGSQSITTLRVSNIYFDTVENGKPVYHQDGFTRDTQSSDPTPGLWNFSDYVWSTVIEDLKNGNAANYKNSNATSEGLTISAPTEKTLTSDTLTITEGSEEDGTLTTTTYNYLRTAASSGVTFSHTRMYPGSDTRNIGVRIVATDDNDEGTPVAPTVKITIGSGAEEDMDLQTGEDGNIKLDDTTLPFASHVYVRENVDMRNVNSVTVKIIPPSDAETRFYKIEFYPRWGDFTAADSDSSGD